MPKPPTPEQEREILKKAFLSRRVDEKLLELFNKGKITGTVHTCIGQELSGAVVCSLLKKGDSVFSNHRGHGHFISFVGDAAGLLSEIMGKATGICGGKGGSQHLCRDGFYSNGIQGGIVPVSLGLAMSRKLQDNGGISCVFVGDGTLGEGTVYEGLNLASKWNLPLLFVLEHNGVAQSTDTKDTIAGDILDRARAFGVRTAHGNTWDWQQLHGAADDLIEYCRREGKPGFLRVDTFRLKAHSKGDDLRPKEHIEEHEKKDPLNVIVKTKPEIANPILAEVEEIVNKAVLAADQAPFPTKDTVKLGPSVESPNARPVTWKTHGPQKGRFGNLLNAAFKKYMKNDPKVLFIGEDVMSPYGGAFKIAEDLSKLFPKQVYSTPISEATIVGLATGLALDGYRPFAEIMFGDFITLAFDQIVNHAAKFEDMYNGQVKVNVAVRTPMGGGRGYGPTHSQTLEKHLLGVPGLRVVAVNNLLEPEPQYDACVNGDAGPLFIVENKRMYTFDVREQLPAGFRLQISNDKFPAIHVKPDSTRVDVTLVAYGGMANSAVDALEKLFVEHDIVGQLFAPVQLYPFSAGRYADILAAAPKLICIEEGQGFGAFSSELTAQLAETGIASQIEISRISPLAMCIPSSGPLEKEILPNVDTIVNAAIDMIQGPPAWPEKDSHAK